MERRIVNPWTWQDNFGFVQANEVTGHQRILYCAGQTSVDDNGNPLYPDDMGAQMNQALANLEIVLKKAGYNLTDVMRLNYYTTDVNLFFEAYEPLAGRLAENGCRYASTLLEVSRLAFPELMIEIEATAVK